MVCEEKPRAKSPPRETILTEFQIKKGIVYKTIAGRKLELLFFLPKDPPQEDMPVMIYTHGGGWRGGNVYSILKPAFLGTLRDLRDAGVAVVAVNYRLAKGKNTAEDCVIDCKDASRFLIKNAGKWNLDSKRIGIWGGSAGGHLALMTALADDALFLGDASLREVETMFQCVVSYYPLTSLERPDLLNGSHFENPEKLSHLLGGHPTEKPELARKLSPIKHLGPNMPPILLIHGERDQVLPISQSDLFLEKAKIFETEVNLLRVRGAAHSLQGKSITPKIEVVNRQVSSFVLGHLKGS